MRGEVARADVADRDRRVPADRVLGEQDRQGRPDELAVADDDHLGAVQPDVRAQEQLHDAVRGGGRERGRIAAHHEPHVERMQPVDVLPGVDRGLDRELRDVPRDRELHDDAVHLGVAVQASQRRQQLALGDVGRQVDLLGAHPDVRARLVLGAEVHPRGLVVAHEDRREPRRDPAGGEDLHALGDLAADLGRDGLAVEDRGGHERQSYLRERSLGPQWRK